MAEDQKSANGTFLRGPNHKISRAILCSGDSLIIGQTRLRIEIDGEADEGSERLIRFVIVEPAALARTYTCRRETLTIGRHSSCDVVIPHGTVSRRHASVIRTPAGFVINDQSSLNAIMVGRHAAGTPQTLSDLPQAQAPGSGLRRQGRFQLWEDGSRGTLQNPRAAVYLSWGGSPSF